MKNIALSINQMKHLVELGLDTSDASMYWQEYVRDEHSDYVVRTELKVMDDDYNNSGDQYATYTLQDILYKLPNDNKNWIEIEMYYSEINLIESVDDEPFVNIAHLVTGKDLLNGAYDMLCWCLENKII